MHASDQDKLIELIYDTAQFPDAWGMVFDALNRCFGFDAWLLLRFHKGASAGAPELLAHGGERISAMAPDRYAEHYSRLDERAAATIKAETGQIVNCQRHFDNRYVARSEFYQDFLIPEGLRYAMASCVHRSPEQDYVVSVQRGIERGWFSQSEEALLRCVTPHLGKALQLAERINETQLRSDIAYEAMNRTDIAVISIDEHFRFHHANRFGESLLRMPGFLDFRWGHIAFSDQIVQQGFYSLVLRCAVSGESGFMLLPPGLDGKRRFSLTVFKASRHSVLKTAAPVSEIICLFSPLDVRRVITVRQLMAFFRLSPAEARLARALATGESLEDYVAAEGVKLTTVKTQLRSIFTKTGTRRQATLVSLLSSIPVVRS